MRKIGTTFLGAAALALFALPATGQTAARYSFQASGIRVATGDFGALDSGNGLEAQIRYNPSIFSIGFGFELSRHDSYAGGLDCSGPLCPDEPVGGAVVEYQDVRLTGLFVEPRYVLSIGSERLAPYLSARFAATRASILWTSIDAVDDTEAVMGVTGNVGGGILFVITSFVNLDVGATVGLRKIGATTVTSVDGLTTVIDFESGTNVVFRVGLAIGLGG